MHRHLDHQYKAESSTYSRDYFQKWSFSLYKASPSFSLNLRDRRRRSLRDAVRYAVSMTTARSRYNMAALMDPRLAGASSKQLRAVAYSGFPVRKITQKLSNNSKFNGGRLRKEYQLACISDPSYVQYTSWFYKKRMKYQSLSGGFFFFIIISRWRVGDSLPGRPKKAPSSCDRSTGEEAGPERV